MKQGILYLLMGGILMAAGGNMNQYIRTLAIQAKKDNAAFSSFSATSGKEIYISKHKGKRGKMVSCASCHTQDLAVQGKNIFTGKIIKPMSPLVNSKRFTKVKKVKKWLRRNFRDVYKREGTAQEKGDVLKYMMQ